MSKLACLIKTAIPDVIMAEQPGFMGYWPIDADHPRGTIVRPNNYFTSRWTDAARRRMDRHELVHYLQNRRGQLPVIGPSPIRNWINRFRAEIPAYWMQDRFVGGHYPVWRRPIKTITGSIFSAGGLIGTAQRPGLARALLMALRPGRRI